jgi:hypothetical protein
MSDDDFDIDNDISGQDVLASKPMGWLPRVVVTVTVVGFVALAWYAYKTGTQSVNDEDLIVVEAEKTPLKEKPDDPGGMKFPNQDKTVFETFAGNTAPPKVERVMPTPEEPIAKPLELSETKSWVNEAAQKKEEKAATKTEQLMGADKPAAIPTVKPQAAMPSAGEEVVSYTKSAAVPEKPGIVEKPVDVGVAEVKTTVKQDTKPDPKPFAVNHSAPAKTTSGKVKVQLGAYQSDKEARAAFAKMQKKFSSLSGRTPTVVKADLGAKGIYYRLRVGGFASDTEAKKFCGGLSAKGQACIVAK